MSEALDAVIGTLDAVGQDTATTPEGNGTVTIVEAAPEMESGAAAEKADPKFIHVPVDGFPELLAAVKKAAGDVPLGPFVGSLLAEKYGVAYERKDARRKFVGTEEEVKAQREAAKRFSIEKAGHIRKALTAIYRAKRTNDAVKLAEAEAYLAKWDV